MKRVRFEINLILGYKHVGTGNPDESGVITESAEVNFPVSNLNILTPMHIELMKIHHRDCYNRLFIEGR